MKILTGGIYTHIPFCLKKCPYCDFYSITDLSLVPRYIDALTHELHLIRDAPQTFDSLYIGGGTPSVLAPEQLGRIIKAVKNRFTILPDAEVTLEVNPGAAHTKALKALRHMGINRINIGVQSFDDTRLTFLGRIHTASEASQTIEAAREAGFANIGLDLIYGLPAQNHQDWLADLKKAVAFNPHHLACYTLTVEPDSLLASEVRIGKYKRPNENQVAQLFALTQSYLASRGYAQYEISNFCRRDIYSSRHNLKYWTLAPYLGLGPAAHSCRPPVRWWNHRKLKNYLEAVEADRTPVAGRETLDREQQMMEAVYLGLRLQRGIDVAKFDRHFNASFYDLFSTPVKILEKENMLHPGAAYCALTQRGMRFHEGITKRFIAEI